jgi:formylglycine-generating enzyme required for sulfatase activity
MKTAICKHAFVSFLCFAATGSFAAKPSSDQQNFHDATTGLDFVSIPAGQFTMGTTDLEQALAEMPKPDGKLIADEIPAHRVEFDHDLLLSNTEVTQQSWYSIMHTRPGPDSHWQHEHWQQLPVVSVSWLDAQQFIDRLNTMSKTWHYRLPTEAEWEYAARAGDASLRPFSTLEMDQYAWFINSSNDEIHPVAQLKPNAFGLYDMFGNAWEWVADWYKDDAYALSSTLNPQGPATGDRKVRRGGSYHCPPHLVRSGYRAADEPTTAYSVLGFRLVAEAR